MVKIENKYRNNKNGFVGCDLRGYIVGVWLVVYLILCNIEYSFADEYNGKLPSGCTCPNCICTSAHCVSVINPQCPGGHTSGCLQDHWLSQSDPNQGAIFYDWYCPNGVWGGDQWFMYHNYTVGSPGPNPNNICVRCNPYDTGDYPNPGCGTGQVWCLQNCYGPNPCQEGTQWNYELCRCDCIDPFDNCKFQLLKKNTEGKVIKCQYEDIFNFDDSSWLWVDLWTVNRHEYSYDTENSRWLNKVEYHIDPQLDDPCDYDLCTIDSEVWVMDNFPDRYAALKCVDVTLHAGHLDPCNQTFNFHSDNEWALEFEGTDVVGTFWQADNPALTELDSCEGHAIGEIEPSEFEVAWQDRTSVPNCWYITSYNLKAIGAVNKGYGTSVESGFKKRDVRNLRGHGGYEKRDQ